jgi:hypothetical protein
MRLVGCYGFGRDPWRLVEIAFYDLDEPLNLVAFVSSNGQPIAIHDLHLLDSSGTRALHGGGALAPGVSDELTGDVRVCFFVEMLEDAPLQTPYGELCLGATTSKPHRLRFVEFYPP